MLEGLCHQIFGCVGRAVICFTQIPHMAVYHREARVLGFDLGLGLAIPSCIISIPIGLRAGSSSYLPGRMLQCIVDRKAAPSAFPAALPDACTPGHPEALPSPILRRLSSKSHCTALHLAPGRSGGAAARPWARGKSRGEPWPPAGGAGGSGGCAPEVPGKSRLKFLYVSRAHHGPHHRVSTLSWWIAQS